MQRVVKIQDVGEKPLHGNQEDMKRVYPKMDKLMQWMVEKSK